MSGKLVLVFVWGLLYLGNFPTGFLLLVPLASVLLAVLKAAWCWFLSYLAILVSYAATCWTF